MCGAVRLPSLAPTGAGHAYFKKAAPSESTAIGEGGRGVPSKSAGSGLRRPLPRHQHRQVNTSLYSQFVRPPKSALSSRYTGRINSIKDLTDFASRIPWIDLRPASTVYALRPEAGTSERYFVSTSVQAMPS